MSNDRPAAESPSPTACCDSFNQNRGWPTAQASHGSRFPAEKPRGAGRRAVVRRRFPHKQYIASYFGGCLPSRASFKEFVCCDLSERGFSFLASSAPDFDCVVIALGVSPDLIYMTARVANRVRISAGPSPLYRIGCRSIERWRGEHIELSPRFAEANGIAFAFKEAEFASNNWGAESRLCRRARYWWSKTMPMSPPCSKK